MDKASLHNGGFGIGRRDVLRGVAAAVFGSSSSFAGDQALESFPLPGGLTLISGAGANALCAPAGAGAVLVDTGAANRADELVALALSKTRAKQVGTVVNTCWRLDHTGANDRFAGFVERIVAHENTRLWMGAEIDSRWEGKVYAPRAPKARPNTTFYTKETYVVGPHHLECGYIQQAQTDGDCYVFFRDANVISVGGAAVGRGWPLIDTATGGWLGGHIRGLELIADLVDGRTQIVPSAGRVVMRDEIRKQHEMHVAIMAKLVSMLESGATIDQVLKSNPAAAYAAERGDPTVFVTQAFKSLWGPVRQFKAI